jgi:hypothetical protein
MKIAWLNNDFTKARVTVEAVDSRWWRRRWVTALVEFIEPNVEFPSLIGYVGWRFMHGGDRVCDHDDALAQAIEEQRKVHTHQRDEDAKRARLRNPWQAKDPSPDGDVLLPRARVRR